MSPVEGIGCIVHPNGHVESEKDRIPTIYSLSDGRASRGIAAGRCGLRGAERETSHLQLDHPSPHLPSCTSVLRPLLSLSFARPVRSLVASSTRVPGLSILQGPSRPGCHSSWRQSSAQVPLLPSSEESPDRQSPWPCHLPVSTTRSSRGYSSV